MLPLTRIDLSLTEQPNAIDSQPTSLFPINEKSHRKLQEYKELLIALNAFDSKQEICTIISKMEDQFHLHSMEISKARLNEIYSPLTKKQINEIEQIEILIYKFFNDAKTHFSQATPNKQEDNDWIKKINELFSNQQQNADDLSLELIFSKIDDCTKEFNNAAKRIHDYNKKFGRKAKFDSFLEYGSIISNPEKIVHWTSFLEQQEKCSLENKVVNDFCTFLKKLYKNDLLQHWMDTCFLPAWNQEDTTISKSLIELTSEGFEMINKHIVEAFSKNNRDEFIRYIESEIVIKINEETYYIKAFVDNLVKIKMIKESADSKFLTPDTKGPAQNAWKKNLFSKMDDILKELGPNYEVTLSPEKRLQLAFIYDSSQARNNRTLQIKKLLKSSIRNPLGKSFQLPPENDGKYIIQLTFSESQVLLGFKFGPTDPFCNLYLSEKQASSQPVQAQIQNQPPVQNKDLIQTQIQSLENVWDDFFDEIQTSNLPNIKEFNNFIELMENCHIFQAWQKEVFSPICNTPLTIEDTYKALMSKINPEFIMQLSKAIKHLEECNPALFECLEIYGEGEKKFANLSETFASKELLQHLMGSKFQQRLVLELMGKYKERSEEIIEKIKKITHENKGKALQRTKDFDSNVMRAWLLNCDTKCKISFDNIINTNSTPLNMSSYLFFLLDDSEYEISDYDISHGFSTLQTQELTNLKDHCPKTFGEYMCLIKENKIFALDYLNKKCETIV